MAPRHPGRPRQLPAASQTVAMLLPPDIREYLQMKAREGRYSVAAAARDVFWSAMRKDLPMGSTSTPHKITVVIGEELLNYLDGRQPGRARPAQWSSGRRSPLDRLTSVHSASATKLLSARSQRPKQGILMTTIAPDFVFDQSKLPLRGPARQAASGPREDRDRPHSVGSGARRCIAGDPAVHRASRRGIDDGP